MRSLAGTVKAAGRPYPELYRQHNEVCKKRKALRDEAKKKRREEYYDTMPKIEVDKQIDQLLNKQNKDLSDAEDDHEDWNPPIPICTTFDNSKYNVFRHSVSRTWQPEDTKATNPFNRSPNRSSSRDHVSYGNIPPSTTRPPSPALSADRREPFHSYTRCSPLHYQIRIGPHHRPKLSSGVL
jgi:hypothetical protein